MPYLVENKPARETLQTVLLGKYLRPLARIGCYRGIAELADDASDEGIRRFLPIVHALLADPDHRHLALTHILPHRPRWMDACKNWLEQAWTHKDLRRALIWTLSSVTGTWAEGVAALLSDWCRRDARVLEEVQWLLHGTHTSESETLFGHWLESLRFPAVQAMTHIPWPEFMTQHPFRAVRTLALILSFAPDSQEQRPKLLSNLPTQPISAFTLLGEQGLDLLLPAWSLLHLTDDLGWHTDDESWWYPVMCQLAMLAAHVWDQGNEQLCFLLDRLPSSLRPADHRLILKTLTLVDWKHQPTSTLADAAMEWLARNPAAWQRRSGFFHHHPWSDSQPVVEMLAVAASQQAVAVFQEALSQVGRQVINLLTSYMA